MEVLLENLPIYMIIGLVVVLGVAQINRLVGSILGILFWASVAMIGSRGYEQGGGIALAGLKLPQAFFYGLCGFLTVVNALSAYAAIKKSRRTVGGGDSSS